jgi:hypothetical protein
MLELNIRYSDTICTMEDAAKIADHFTDAVNWIVHGTKDTVNQFTKIP